MIIEHIGSEICQSKNLINNDEIITPILPLSYLF